MAIPLGEANRALQSTRTAQRTFDRVDGTQIQRAGQLIRQGYHTATAPVRYTQQQLARAAVGTFSITRSAGQQLLNPIRTTAAQYHVAKILDRNGVDGNDINRIQADGGEIGPAVTRNGDDAAQTIVTDGGGEVWRVHQLDLDVNSEALASNIMRHSDEIDVERVIDDLETLSQANVDGVNGLTTKLAAGDASNIKGAAFEAEVAVRNGPENINRMSQNNPEAPGEIDIVTDDGNLIEATVGDASVLSRGDRKYDRLENTQIPGYQTYRDRSNEIPDDATIEIAIRTEPSNDLQDLANNHDNVKLTQYKHE